MTFYAKLAGMLSTLSYSNIKLARSLAEEQRLLSSLRDSEQRHRAVVDNLEVGISLLNPNMEILEVNKALKRYFPHVRPACGQICYEQYNDPPRSEPCSYCPCVLTLQDGKVHEAITETPAGSEIRYYHLVSSPIKDSDGRVQYVIELTEDITERKKAQESLGRASQEWERTFNAISDLVMVLDDRHKILRANKAMADALGMTERELIGKSCFELVHGEKEPPAFCPHAQLLADGAEHSAEVLEPRLGGIFDVRVSPLVGQDGQVIGSVHISHNITERKMKEEALQESQERFRLTFQTSPDSININRLSDGLYLDVNDGFTAITGYSREEVIGKSSLELDIWHNPQDRQRLVESLKEAGYVPNLEAKFRFKDGTVITGLMSARVIMLKGEPHIVSITRNIEEWRRTQEALRESEQRYLALFEESIDGVYSVLRAGEITDANASFCELFGYTREEMIGKDIRELYFDPTDRPKFQKEIEKIGFVKDYEVKLRKRDGTEIDCLLTSSVHFGQDGSIAGYRGILRDLTLRKGLQRQLVQAQKMESVGTLAGGIAHDFNNLLQVVLGYSDLVLADDDLPDQFRNDLEKILLAGRNGADLVQRLLTFSRKTETRPLDLDLNQRIRQTQKFLQRTIPKMIDIELMLAEDLPGIHADLTQMDQVLMNLAVNARDAMPEGGKIVIETAGVVLDDDYARSHLEAKPGSYVLLRVSDTGSGIDRETLEHIFEPFYTTKGPGEGTGLGLAMVYGIVKQHRGFINCYSEVGHGTTFKIYLPAVSSKPKSYQPVVASAPHGGTETILLVDDEELISNLGERILTKAGYTVLTACNGKEALAIYRKERSRIALVILDLIMPEMGGKQCLEEILKITPRIKVLIASGYSANTSSKEALQGGAKGFVNKPYDMHSMLRTVRDVLDGE
jgi:PAS domain S-box-containing protein